MPDDFYATLGVSKGADAEAIKRAYRKLAKDLHPDKNPGNAQAEARFKAVNRAFDALSDPAKRALYDEFGEDGLREGFDAEKARAYKSWQQQGGGFRGGFGGSSFGGAGEAVDLEDLLRGFGGGGFGGDAFGGRGRRRGPVRGQDYEQILTVDLAAAVRGTTLEIRSPATGKPVTVRIPPGADEGSRVRVSSLGGASPNGGPNGDLVLQIHIEPHPFFRREGADLHVEVPITVSEAYSGAKVKVPTADAPVTVTVPPRTQSGTKLRLRGKGVARKGKAPGDLYVRFLVQAPTSDAPEVQKLVDELAKHQAGDPRAALYL